MTQINTGPTATAMHHALAWAHSATGIDPLWLFAGLMVGIFAVFCTAGIAVEKVAQRKRHRRGATPIRRSA